jgi:phosphomannomutase
VVPDSVLSILSLKGLAPSGGTVAISENSSMAVEDEAKGMGLRVVRSRVGKTFAALVAEGAVFASEPSKIVDPRWGLWEDGINAAAAIAGLLSREPGLLEKVLSEVQWRYRQVNLEVSAKMRAVAPKAVEAFRKLRIVEERTLDGFKLVFADGSWVMFRASGTEPKTRVYCESKDPQVLDLLALQGAQIVESSL